MIGHGRVRALGRRYGLASFTEPASRAAGVRGILERLLTTDPDSGQTLDLGAVQATAKTVSLSMLANLADSATLQIPSDEALLVTSIRGVSTGAYLAAFLQVEGATKRPWQSQAVHSGNLFGTGQQPLQLWTPDGRGPGPMLLPPLCTLEVQASDLSGAANDALITFDGLRIPADVADLPRLARMASETPYIVVSDAFTVPAGIGQFLNPRLTLQMDGDAPFVTHYINATTRTGYSLSFRGKNEREDWFDEPVPAENLLGTGNLPGGLTMMRGLQAGENLDIIAMNRTAGAIAVTQLALIGAKDWRRG